MPHHSTNTKFDAQCYRFLWQKQNNRLTPEGWYEKNAAFCIHSEVARRNSKKQKQERCEIIIFFPTESCFTAINTGLTWLILGLFYTSLCWLVRCSKTALMPFRLLYRHFLCAILAPWFVVFSSPYHRDLQPQKRTHNQPLGAPRFVAIVSLPRMSNAVTVNLQSPRSGQWLLQGLKKATLRKQEV